MCQQYRCENCACGSGYGAVLRTSAPTFTSQVGWWTTHIFAFAAQHFHESIFELLAVKIHKLRWILCEHANLSVHKRLL